MLGYGHGTDGSDGWRSYVPWRSTLGPRGGRGDVARTLAVCRHVVKDRDDMVVKALSWALRSLVEWDRAAVSAFLREHQGTLAGRVTREVSTKLRTDRKH